jgi:hypothetical protein
MGMGHPFAFPAACIHHITTAEAMAMPANGSAAADSDWLPPAGSR